MMTAVRVALLLALAGPAVAAPPPSQATLAPALARAAGRAGQWQAAARLWRELTVARPADAAAWAGLGHALLALDRVEDAASALDRAAVLQPAGRKADPDLLLDRGRAALALDDGAAARTAFAALAALRPADARAQTGLGIAYDMAGDHAAAQSAYARALDIDPLYEAARANMTLSRALAGNRP